MPGYKESFMKNLVNTPHILSDKFHVNLTFQVNTAQDYTVATTNQYNLLFYFVMLLFDWVIIYMLHDYLDM
jgi:hypothetical protein